jgi:hypothetical protein
VRLALTLIEQADAVDAEEEHPSRLDQVVEPRQPALEPARGQVAEERAGEDGVEAACALHAEIVRIRRRDDARDAERSPLERHGRRVDLGDRDLRGWNAPNEEARRASAPAGEVEQAHPRRVPEAPAQRLDHRIGDGAARGEISDGRSLVAAAGEGKLVAEHLVLRVDRGDEGRPGAVGRQRTGVLGDRRPPRGLEHGVVALGFRVRHLSAGCSPSARKDRRAARVS